MAQWVTQHAIVCPEKLWMTLGKLRFQIAPPLPKSLFWYLEFALVYGSYMYLIFSKTWLEKVRYNKSKSLPYTPKTTGGFSAALQIFIGILTRVSLQINSSTPLPWSSRLQKVSPRYNLLISLPSLEWRSDRRCSRLWSTCRRQWPWPQCHSSIIFWPPWTLAHTMLFLSIKTMTVVPWSGRQYKFFLSFRAAFSLKKTNDLTVYCNNLINKDRFYFIWKKLKQM